MTPELDKALCADFPLFFAERGLSPRESCMGRGFECRDGWAALIRGLASKLEPLLEALPEDQRFRAAQVKEKFGTLRVYLNGPTTDEVYALVREAENQSASTCEVCGMQGILRKSRPYIQTLCDLHEKQVLDGRTAVEKHQDQQRKTRELKLLKRTITEYEGRSRNAQTPEAKEDIEQDLLILRARYDELFRRF